jgi:hypothetical protein
MRSPSRVWLSVDSSSSRDASKSRTRFCSASKANTIVPSSTIASTCKTDL